LGSGNPRRKHHAVSEEAEACIPIIYHWTFQQNNDPKQSSNSTKAWLQKNTWKILQRPSSSPDLNPIENLLWDLKTAVAARKPKNITELEAIAHEEWAKIPQKRSQKLVSGYKSNLQQVITAKGYSTKDVCHERVE